VLNDSEFTGKNCTLQSNYIFIVSTVRSHTVSESLAREKDW
jgi:hypothetical protein